MLFFPSFDKKRNQHGITNRYSKGSRTHILGAPHPFSNASPYARKTGGVCPNDNEKPSKRFDHHHEISLNGQRRVPPHYYAKLEYSYDTEGHHFMDLDTYEDSVLDSEMIGEDDCFLVEGNTYDILLVDGDPVRLELPASVEATVVEAADAVCGIPRAMFQNLLLPIRDHHSGATFH